MLKNYFKNMPTSVIKLWVLGIAVSFDSSCMTSAVIGGVLLTVERR